jgi:hypothetical protein
MLFCNRLVFGNLKTTNINVYSDLSCIELGIILPLCFLTLLFGFFPDLIFDTIGTSCQVKANNFSLVKDCLGEVISVDLPPHNMGIWNNAPPCREVISYKVNPENSITIAREFVILKRTEIYLVWLSTGWVDIHHTNPTNCDWVVDWDTTRPAKEIIDTQVDTWPITTVCREFVILEATQKSWLVWSEVDPIC